MFIKSFESEKGPKAIGPYSPAVKLGDFVYASGQLPVNEEGKIDETIELQTRACLENMKNLLAVQNGQVLLLQKPRRGWYVAPGGKMESGESIYEAAIREFQEETNVTPQNVHLKGVYTMIINPRILQFYINL